MNAQDFAFWFQGYLEISGAKELSEQELNIIKDHLKLVFDKRTPAYYPAYSSTQPAAIGGSNPLSAGYIGEAPFPSVLVTC